MGSNSDTSLIKEIVDVIGFLVLSVGLVIRSLIRLFLPGSYEPIKSCEDEIAVITGGGSGIGRLLALRLARLGSTVVIWDINEAGISETIKLVEGIGGKVCGYVCNVADREDVYKVAKRVAEEVGEVTMLINNAGIVSGNLFLKTPDHMIQKTFDVNILSHFWTTKAFLPNMIKNSRGHVVTIASMAGHVGIGKLVDYCSSKYAAVGFDEALRVELEAQGIRGVKTLCVCPYFIQSTGMFDDVFSRFVPTLKSNDVADRIILGIRREELIVMMPSMFRYLLWLKWCLPWGIMSMLLRNLVPDASPHGEAHPVNPTITSEEKADTNVETAFRQRVLVSEKQL